MSQYRWSAEYHQAAIPGLRKRRDGLFDFPGVSQIERGNLDPERWCHPLHGTELAECDGSGRISDDRHAL